MYLSQGFTLQVSFKTPIWNDKKADYFLNEKSGCLFNIRKKKYGCGGGGGVVILTPKEDRHKAMHDGSFWDILANKLCSFLPLQTDHAV